MARIKKENLVEKLTQMTLNDFWDVADDLNLLGKISPEAALQKKRAEEVVALMEKEPDGLEVLAKAIEDVEEE